MDCRIKKYIGTNDQRSIRKGKYITKKDRIEKIKDDRLKENIKNKCMVIGCSNEFDYYKYMNTFCDNHQNM